MAYNFIPTSPMEITNKIKGHVGQEIAAVFIQLTSKHKTIKDPIALDVSKPSNVKVTRKLQGDLDLGSINKNFKLIKISFGEGSRGGRGTGNRGNLFEVEFSSDLKSWWSDNESISNKKTKPTIEELVKKYNIDTWKELNVIPEGEKNQKRPLLISGKSVIISPGLRDIGSIVTDITLKNEKQKTVYLSLKFEQTVTFFNAGTKKFLSDDELESGLIKNPDGLVLLEMFGLENAIFCSVFNRTGKNFQSVNTTNKVNKELLENLIRSGIGYGYHMIHKTSKGIISKEITEDYRNKASKVESVICYYGGKTGTGVRVDIEVVTPVYILKFNFRNKQGGKYISHLMCDYSYRN